MFLVISGISGSGKSTIGQKLAESLNLTYLDLDSFYLPQKPVVTLSNGSQVKNWDTLEALDIETFKMTVREKVPQGLILVGFAITDEILEIKPNLHIHLSTGRNKEDIIKRCIASRRQSKGFKDDDFEPLRNGKIRIDEIMVREIVYPFYLDTVSKSTIDYTVEVFDYDYGPRKTVDEIVETILIILNV